MKFGSLIILFFLSFYGSAQTPDSLSIKIGQMIMIGMPKAEVDSAVLAEVKTGKVGALIYFEKNIPKSSSAFAAFKKMSWTYQKAASIPLFICIDQEGGKVNRLKEKYGFTRSVTAQDIGKSKSLDSVRFYAEATAATLAGLGINVNFAPCVDVAVNPDNPVIVKHGRSYSANEDSVSLFAKEVVKEHRKYGVVTTLKHFPGHGSSQDDTHLGLADVTNTWQERELKPYRELISTGYADAIMTSHIVNKKLDHHALPGTLSKSILDSLLRKKLGYRGVIFSDDMQMKAIASNYGLEEAIRLSINAGVDILCFSNNIQGVEERTVEKVHTIIKKFVNNGAIPVSRIDESYHRVMNLKKRFGGTELEVAKKMNVELTQKIAGQAEALKKTNEELQQWVDGKIKWKKKKKPKKT
ncbi:MAG: glycoside hydrolase family 3 protein [Bacteroidetes bacterium]|nr:glycoside hydrolase family 3 protein [Bacteroidota bacterium]